MAYTGFTVNIDTVMVTLCRCLLLMFGLRSGILKLPKEFLKMLILKKSADEKVKNFPAYKGLTCNSIALAFVAPRLFGCQILRQYILRYTVGNSLTSLITSHIIG